ncbi:MAG: LamG-like jellyroll fold domain-containing protein [Acidimicrobiales bacterium]
MLTPASLSSPLEPATRRFSCRATGSGRTGRFAGAITALLLVTSLCTAAVVLSTPRPALADGSTTGTCNYDSIVEGDTVTGSAGSGATIGPLTGLADYWKLNEASGTSATDSGPGGDTGTYQGAPTLNTAPGPIECDPASGSVGLNGTSQYVTTSVAETSAALTAGAWFRFTGTAGTASIILADCTVATGGCATATNVTQAIFMNSANELAYTFRKTAFTYTTISSSATQLVDDGRWHFAVVMMTTGTANLVCGATNNADVVLYLDGTCVASSTTAPAALPTTYAYFGVDPGAPSGELTNGPATCASLCGYWKGNLGRIAFWASTTALTYTTLLETEANAIGGSCDYDTLSGAPSTYWGNFAPVDDWALNETSGTTATNTGSNGAAYNGTYQGAATLNQIPGALGCDQSSPGVGLASASDQYISTASATTIWPANIALSAWFKTSSPSGEIMAGCSTATGGCATSSNSDYHLFVNASGDLVFDVPGVSLTYATATVDTGVWDRVSVEVSSTANLPCGAVTAVAYVALYLNGNCVADSTTGPGAAPAGTLYWYLGADPGGTSANFTGEPATCTTSSHLCDFLNGQIARVAVYAPATSPNPAIGLAGYLGSIDGAATAASWTVSSSVLGAIGVTATWAFTTASASSLTSVIVGVPAGTAGVPALGAVVGLSVAGASVSAVVGGLITVTLTAQNVPSATAVSIVLTGLQNSDVAGAYSSSVTTASSGTTLLPLAPGTGVDAAAGIGGFDLPEALTLTNACGVGAGNHCAATNGTSIEMTAFPGAGVVSAVVVLSIASSAGGGYKLQSYLAAALKAGTYTLPEGSTSGSIAVGLNQFVASASLSGSSSSGAALCTPYGSGTPYVGYGVGAGAAASIWRATSQTLSGAPSLDTVTITDSVSVSLTQPAGVYSGTIHYTVATVWSGGPETC